MIWNNIVNEVLQASVNGDLFMPRTKRTIGMRVFFIAAPRIWNSLSADLKQHPTTATFKWKLMTFSVERSCGLNISSELCNAPPVSVVGGALEISKVTFAARFSAKADSFETEVHGSIGQTIVCCMFCVTSLCMFLFTLIRFILSLLFFTSGQTQ